MILVYFETERKTTAQTLTFKMGATSTVATWRIKVNQIECASNYKAPSDCLQYFTGPSGTVTSLNWPTQSLDEVMYAICIRRENGYCGKGLSHFLFFKTFYLNVFTIAGIQYSETQGIATGADAFDLDAATAIALRVSISSIHA